MTNALLLRRRGMITTQHGGGTPVFYDRLVFDGVAYIITDIIPPADFSVAARGGNETIKAPQRFLMCTATVGNIGFIMGSATTSTTRHWSVHYGASSSLITKALAFAQYPTYTIIFTPKRFGFGNNTNTFTKGTGTPNGYLHIGQNPTLVGQPYSGEMGIVQIYDSTAQDATSYSELTTNYTPVYRLIPCTLNGEAGLWNVEGNKFYGNSAGAGVLNVLNLP